MKLEIIIVFIFCLVACVLSTHDKQHKHIDKEKEHHHAKKHKSNHLNHHQKHARVIPHHKHSGIHHREDKKKDGVLIYNEEIKLIGFANSSARVAAFLDFKAKIVSLEGQNGETILYDIEQNAIYTYTDPNHPGKDTFQAYFDTIHSLADFKEKGQVHNISAAKNNSEILKLANLVHGNLGYKVRENSSDGFDIFQKNVANIKEALDIDEFVFRGKVSIEGLPVNVGRIVNVVLSIKILFESGDALNETKIDIGAILKTRNGLEGLLSLLETIQDHVDLSKLAQSTINNPEKILQVLVLLGTGKHAGIDGYYNVLYNIVSLIRGHADLDIVIKSILDFFACGGISDTDLNELREIYEKILDILTKQDSVFHNAPGLSTLRKFLEGLKDNKFSINEINFSEVIVLLINGKPADTIQIIIKIIISWGRFVGPEKGIQTLFTVLVHSLNSTESANFLKDIIPNLRNASEYLSSHNPLQAILNGTNVANLTNIQNVPVIGEIYISISKQIAILSNGNSNLTEIFNPANTLKLFQNIIKDFVNSGNSIFNVIQAIPGQVAEAVEDGINFVVDGIESIVGGNKPTTTEKVNSTEAPSTTSKKEESRHHKQHRHQHRAHHKSHHDERLHNGHPKEESRRH